MLTKTLLIAPTKGQTGPVAHAQWLNSSKERGGVQAVVLGQQWRTRGTSQTLDCSGTEPCGGHISCLQVCRCREIRSVNKH